MSRQEWLRTRQVEPEPVDPRPAAGAILKEGADTMRDMVNRQVASMHARMLAEEAEDEHFDELDEDEDHFETVHTMAERIAHGAWLRDREVEENPAPSDDEGASNSEEAPAPKNAGDAPSEGDSSGSQSDPR